MNKTLRSERVGESYTEIDHPSGLKIILYPMPGFASAYALFATRYGSIDRVFRAAGEADFAAVPDGVAHFLEHKMFDAESGDVFSRFAALGASANAYTAFDKTAYLFSCTERVADCLEVLLDFVQHPHFTPEKVMKEQGIIGQEIRMYDDDGDWRVFFNLLGALYKNHPIRVDIAGTEASIADITADTLWRCYRAFYNLCNMVLVVAGNIDPAEALAVADRVLVPARESAPERAPVCEPEGVNLPRAEQSLEVAMPLFQIGFKATPRGYPQNAEDAVYLSMLLEILAGEGSELYRELYDGGLINQTFSADAQDGESTFYTVFSGESRDPDAVYAKIKEAIAALARDGFSDEDFELSRRIFYGRALLAFGSVHGLASSLLNAHFTGIGVYEQLELVSRATRERLGSLIETHLDSARSCISIVWPGDGGEPA